MPPVWHSDQELFVIKFEGWAPKVAIRINILKGKAGPSTRILRATRKDIFMLITITPGDKMLGDFHFHCLFL